MQGRMLDLENNLRDETTEKKRLEREIKAKDRENQTALTEVRDNGTESLVSQRMFADTRLHVQLEHKLSTTQEQLRDLKSALASSTSTNNKLKGMFLAYTTRNDNAQVADDAIQWPRAGLDRRGTRLDPGDQG